MDWIGRVNRMNSKRKVGQVFNNNPQRSSQRVRPKNRWWNCVQTHNGSCRIKKKIEREVKKKTELNGRSPLRRERSILNCNGM